MHSQNNSYQFYKLHPLSNSLTNVQIRQSIPSIIYFNDYLSNSSRFIVLIKDVDQNVAFDNSA